MVFTRVSDGSRAFTRIKLVVTFLPKYVADTYLSPISLPMNIISQKTHAVPQDVLTLFCGKNFKTL